MIFNYRKRSDYFETIIFDLFNKSITLVLPLLVIYILGVFNDVDFLSVYLISGLVITIFSYISGLGYDVLTVQRRSKRLAYDFMTSVFIFGLFLSLLVLPMVLMNQATNKIYGNVLYLICTMWFSHLLAQSWLIRVLSDDFFIRFIFIRLIGVFSTLIVVFSCIKELHYLIVFTVITNVLLVGILLKKVFKNGSLNRYLTYSYLYKRTWRWRIRQVVNNLIDPVSTWLIVAFIHDPLKLASLTLGLRLITVSRKLGTTGMRAKLVGRMFKSQHNNYNVAGGLTFILGGVGGWFLNFYLQYNELPLITESWVEALILMLALYFLGYISARKEHSLWMNKEVFISFLLAFFSCAFFAFILFYFDSLYLIILLMLFVLVMREQAYVFINKVG